MENWSLEMPADSQSLIWQQKRLGMGRWGSSYSSSSSWPWAWPPPPPPRHLRVWAAHSWSPSGLWADTLKNVACHFESQSNFGEKSDWNNLLQASCRCPCEPQLQHQQSCFLFWLWLRGLMTLQKNRICFKLMLRFSSLPWWTLWRGETVSSSQGNPCQRQYPSLTFKMLKYLATWPFLWHSLHSSRLSLWQWEQDSCKVFCLTGAIIDTEVYRSNSTKGENS